jgi:hypothetical protein
LECLRADDYETNEAVMKEIWKAICQAQVVIAEMTGLNPNVMYEFGTSHTFGTPTIMMVQPSRRVDPITVSIAFISLSRPIGGLLFGVAYWKISKTISYEKNIKTYMIISGWGIFLIFSANQGEAQIVSPYPPFGLVTITVLKIAAFLMLLIITCVNLYTNMH